MVWVRKCNFLPADSLWVDLETFSAPIHSSHFWLEDVG